jgi:hypothetical protein
MSISIVHHVREKSQSKGSARTLLLNLAIYANDCCGVAWPADATLHHDVNVSRQRIHELKNTVEATGELVIVERPGTTNLYFVAWQGQPLGGTSSDTGRHDPHCPLRTPRLAARCASLRTEHCTTPEVREGSAIPDTSVMPGVSEAPDPQDSEGSDRRCQTPLTRKTTENRCENTSVPATVIVHRPQDPPLSILPKAEQASPFWCQACGFAIPTCAHRVVYGSARGRPKLAKIVFTPVRNEADLTGSLWYSTGVRSHAMAE